MSVSRFISCTCSGKNTSAERPPSLPDLSGQAVAREQLSQRLLEHGLSSGNSTETICLFHNALGQQIVNQWWPMLNSNRQHKSAASYPRIKISSSKRAYNLPILLPLKKKKRKIRKLFNWIEMKNFKLFKERGLSDCYVKHSCISFVSILDLQNCWIDILCSSSD